MISIGIDVSKLQLDWAAGPEASVERVANHRRGIRALVRRLSQLKPDRIVVESTGGYERPLLQALAEAGLGVVLVNPWRVRRFGEGLGKLAKTDAIDARLLAHFGAVADLKSTPFAWAASASWPTSWPGVVSFSPSSSPRRTALPSHPGWFGARSRA